MVYQAPNSPMGSQETQHQSPILGRPRKTPPQQSCSILKALVQQPVKEVQAAGVQCMAGYFPSINTEPVEWRGGMCPMSQRRTGETGKIQVGGASTSLSQPRTQPREPGCTSDAKVVLLNDLSVPEVRVVPKEKYQLSAGLGMA